MLDSSYYSGSPYLSPKQNRHAESGSLHHPGGFFTRADELREAQGDSCVSIRGIQKRIEYYAKKAGLKISCHNLRHTWADQMLTADAELETFQDLLEHSWITTTQRYCRFSNKENERDYFKAMEVVMQRTGPFLPGP